MYDEINVSFKGRHFFATAPRSLTSEADMKKAAAVFSVKFPEEEGYKMHITEWETSVKVINLAA